MRSRRVHALWVIAALPLAPATVAANTSGTVTASVVTATRSISVSQTSVTYGQCGGTSSVLNFPNQGCMVGNQANIITVTNGGATAHIDETGSDFVPQDAGTHWVLCGGAGPACTGTPSSNGPLPARDQVEEQDFAVVNNTPVLGPLLDNSAQCDTSFSSGTSDPCLANPSQAVDFHLQMIGPSSTTDNSASFTTTITWTAAP